MEDTVSAIDAARFFIAASGKGWGKMEKSRQWAAGLHVHWGDACFSGGPPCPADPEVIEAEYRVIGGLLPDGQVQGDV